jgi:hypothetical protein
MKLIHATSNKRQSNNTHTQHLALHNITALFTASDIPSQELQHYGNLARMCWQRLFFMPRCNTIWLPIQIFNNATTFKATPASTNNVWIVMIHAQKPDFFFRRNGRVHLYWQGHQFSRLLVAEVCASAVIMLGTTSSEVVWRVLATHSIRQFPLHYPSSASPCAITFQLDSTYCFCTTTIVTRACPSVTLCVHCFFFNSSWPWNVKFGIQSLRVMMMMMMIRDYEFSEYPCTKSQKFLMV